MKNLLLLTEENTQYISFKEDGLMLIEGRSLEEDPINFYSILFDWIQTQNIKKIKLISRIESKNAVSTELLFKLLNTLMENKDIESINGEIIEEKLKKTKFNSVEYADFEYA